MGMVVCWERNEGEKHHRNVLCHMCTYIYTCTYA